jgi:hypothetical protein
VAYHPAKTGKEVSLPDVSVGDRLWQTVDLGECCVVDVVIDKDDQGCCLLARAGDDYVGISWAYCYHHRTLAAAIRAGVKNDMDYIREVKCRADRANADLEAGMDAEEVFERTCADED